MRWRGVERLGQAGQAATETGQGGTGGACQPATGGEEKVNLGTGASQLGALGALGVQVQHNWEKGNEYWHQHLLNRQGAATGKEKVKICRNKKYANCAQI